VNGGPATCRTSDGASVAECDIVPDAVDETPQVGSSVCTYAPDYECYVTGWPACCGLADNSTTVSDGCPSGETHECDQGLSEETPNVLEDDNDASSATMICHAFLRGTCIMIAMIALVECLPS